jgi:hypothetical protein
LVPLHAERPAGTSAFFSAAFSFLAEGAAKAIGANADRKNKAEAVMLEKRISNKIWQASVEWEGCEAGDSGNGQAAGIKCRKTLFFGSAYNSFWWYVNGSVV